jgi:flagellar M-ring protein FliF
VTRLNVAVLVDEATVTEDQRAQIESMIGTAAGVDLARGDQVSVTRLPFDTSAADEAIVASEQEAIAAAAAERTSMIRTGVIAGIILIAMVLAYRSTRRARREVATPIDIGAIRAAQIGEQQTAAIPAGLAGVGAVDMSSREALDELSALAERQPRSSKRAAAPGRQPSPSRHSGN